MKCLRKYKWLKLHRACLPSGRGIMGYWAKLASRAAFRKGYGVYCGFRNPVEPGMWAGGIVGLKSILGVKRRQKALWIMHELEDLGYLKFTHDLQTKKVTYQICDWEHACSGGECEKGAVYATDEFGFLGMPRTLTDRLADSNRIFDEADAWLDLWCHTTYRDYGNAFSFLGPAIQFGKYGSVLTLEGLGHRWNWEKTKVWRFFKKNESTFKLFRLPSSYGCVIFNAQYLQGEENKLPEGSDVLQMLEDIKCGSRKGIVAQNETERINMMVAWNSSKVVKALEEKSSNESEETRVAPLNTYTRAYFSHGRNYYQSRNCIYDCLGWLIGAIRYFDLDQIGTVCPIDIPRLCLDTI